MNSRLRRTIRYIIHANGRNLQNKVSRTARLKNVEQALLSDTNNECSRWTLHPLRYYSQVENRIECWNCRSRTQAVDNFICDTCGKLQDISKEHDYFKLLSIPQKFDVPLPDLTKSFRRLQTLVHPDKFSNKSDREKKNSADWSALLNKAYKTLSQPIVRGEYLLKLKGEDISHETSMSNKEFLAEMMERNEEVAAAKSIEELQTLNEKLQEEVNTQLSKVEKLFNSKDLAGAKRELIRTKYLLSIQISVKTKLEKLMYK